MGSAETICMRVGEQDRIDFSDFVAALNNFLGLLKDVDSAVANRRSGNLHWRVTALKKDPMPVVGFTPFQRRAAEDISATVERQVSGDTDSAQICFCLTTIDTRYLYRMAMTAASLSWTLIVTC